MIDPAAVITEGYQEAIGIMARVVTPEEYGADPTGVNDSAQAFRDMFDDLKLDGGVVTSFVSATYKLLSVVNATTSNIWVDMGGAEITCPSIGGARIEFLGVEGTPLSNITFRRCRFTGRMQGTSFTYCDDSVVEKCSRGGLGQGTAFRGSSCNRCTFRDLLVTEGQDPTIGFLLFDSSDCSIERFNLDGTIARVGLQVKGGRRNVVRDCTIANMGGDVINAHYAFFLRGDAPWSTPGEPDRITKHVTVSHCRVSACPFHNAFHAQESQEITYAYCYDDGDVRNGLVGAKVVGGSESDFRVVDYRGKNIVEVDITWTKWPP